MSLTNHGIGPRGGQNRASGEHRPIHPLGFAGFRVESGRAAERLGVAGVDTGLSPLKNSAPPGGSSAALARLFPLSQWYAAGLTAKYCVPAAAIGAGLVAPGALFPLFVV
jgi:hypothetical protein